MTEDWFSINGDPPELAGKTLQELLVKSCWHNGELQDEANTIHLLVNNTWHELYFDNWTLFWRPGSGRPEPHKEWCPYGTRSGFEIIDLGRERKLIGTTIAGYTMSVIEGGPEVVIQFVDGRTVGFRSIGDNAEIIKQPEAADG